MKSLKRIKRGNGLSEISNRYYIVFILLRYYFISYTLRQLFYLIAKKSIVK